MPLLAQAVPHIAHLAIRNVGTFGGSVSLADPAAEWPACALALDATLVVAGRGGERRVAGARLLPGLYDTALQPGEMLVARRVSAAAPATGRAFLELARRHGDYAIVGVAAHARVDAGPRFPTCASRSSAWATRPCSRRRPPRRSTASAPSADVVKAAQDASRASSTPPADLYTSSATKLHLARVLTGRALAALVA